MMGHLDQVICVYMTVLTVRLKFMFFNLPRHFAGEAARRYADLASLSLKDICCYKVNSHLHELFGVVFIVTGPAVYLYFIRM